MTYALHVTERAFIMDGLNNVFYIKSRAIADMSKSTPVQKRPCGWYRDLESKSKKRNLKL